MSHSITIEPVVLSHLPENLDGLKILDVGIGHGQWAFILRSRKLGVPYIVGVEPYEPYINWAIKVGLYDKLYKITIQQYLQGFKTRFNIILCCEVVEHQATKREALELVNLLYERLLPGGRLIVTTPLGHSSGAPDYDGNELNAHPIGLKSGDFKELGFEVEEVEREGSLNRLGRIIGPLAKIWFTIKRGKFPVTHSIVATKVKKCLA